MLISIWSQQRIYGQKTSKQTNKQKKMQYSKFPAGSSTDLCTVYGATRTAHKNRVLFKDTV